MEVFTSFVKTLYCSTNYLYIGIMYNWCKIDWHLTMNVYWAEQ
jgi:hypothetical protein